MFNNYFLNAILEASFVVQSILFFLIVLSITTWAIILFKLLQFKKQRQQNKQLEEVFWDNLKNAELIKKSLVLYPESNIAQNIEVLYLPYFQKDKLLPEKIWTRKASAITEDTLFFLESRLSILATVGSSAPFIGLLGTVWGIMMSFHKIALSGSASLSVVAPGLSEALIATAVGLFAAIPASVAYNMFIRYLSQQERYLENFNNDLLEVLTTDGESKA
ncbi:MAG: protein TolQ [Bdellovibrionaceae bacterium]|nr:protein TolQ [Pseudobdellovibrionaceae bacterium]